MKSFIFGVMGLSMGAAFAQEIAYGFEIGKPLPLAECPKAKIAYAWTYRPNIEAPCLQTVPVTEAPGVFDQSARIVFPPSTPPALASRNAVGATIVDGTLEALIVWTAGYSVQQFVLDELTMKYGQPTQLTRTPFASGYGAPVGGLQAGWQLPTGVSVIFSGVLGSFDQGIVQIGTQKGLDAYSNRLKNALKKTPL